MAVGGLLLLAFAVSRGYWLMLPGFVVVGIGSGIFGPSIANLLLTEAPAEQAGAMNGTRLTLQNLGWVVSTALGLTIITAPLAAGLRHQFFDATVSRLSPGAIASLQGSYRAALIVLAAFGAFGALTAALSRRSVTAGATRYVVEAVRDRSHSEG